MWERQFGERIHQLRMERNLSRVEFGKLIGLTARYVGNIERGNHTITGATIARICGVVGVSADFIMFGTSDPLTDVAALNGFTYEQAQLTLDMVMSVIKFLYTPTANYALIQEVLRQHKSVFTP